MATIKIDSNELKTREMLDAYRDANWSQHRAILAIVFKAKWEASLTVDRVNLIADALCFTEGCDLQDELTAAVKAKVLRRRFVRNGRTPDIRYEVNY